MYLFKKYLPQINFIILLLLVIVMPFNHKSTGLLIGLSALFSLLDGILNKSFHITNKRIFITGIAFFLIHLISVVYSNHKDIGWFDIEVKLSLLIFPIIFIVRNKFIQKYYKYIFIAFASSIILENIYLLSIGLYNAEIVNIWHVSDEEIWRFSSSNLSKYIHPSYLAMYNLFVISFLINQFTKQKDKLRYLLIVPIIFLSFLIFLLQSKAGLIALSGIILYTSLLFYNKINNKLLKYSLPVFLLISLGFAISQNHRMKSMYTSLVDIVQTGDSSSKSTGLRFEIWKATSKIIKQNLIFGVGAGDIKHEINKEFKNHPSLLKEAIEKHLNVHNQYLETFLGQGIIGISLLLALLYLAFKEASKRKEWLLTAFLIIIVINFFPESMLNNRAGVIFFGFFYYYLFLFNKEERQTTS